jgi:ATP synthase protein I
MLPAAARVPAAPAPRAPVPVSAVTMADRESSSATPDGRDAAGQDDGRHGRAWTYGRPAPDRAARTDGPAQQNAGWTIFSYLLSGMLAYGLIGWLVSRVTHIALIFPLGMLVGLVLAIVLIVFKYGRP